MSLRFQVGAALDADATRVFVPLEEAARRAAARVSGTFAQGTRGAAQPLRREARDAERAFTELAREMQGKSLRLTGGTKAIVDFAKDARTHFSAVRRDFETMSRDVERGMHRLRNGASMGGGSGSRGSASAMGIGPGAAFSAAAKGAGKVLSVAQDIAGGVARGAGLELDYASHAARGRDLRQRATDLSNAGYMAGDANNGRRQDPRALVAEARDVGNFAAYDPTKAMEGLQKFVAKTGDLKLGREVFKDLAVLARATGADLEDVVDAAGDVASNLGDVPDKGKRVVDVLTSVASQGKLGAIEIKDLASQMARVASAAPQFEGDAATNIKLMTALAQEARGKGGAASAPEAASAVQTFVSTFSKGARIKEFKAAGIEVFSSKEKGKIRDPRELLIESLKKTGADPNRLNALFQDENAKKVVRGFATVYRDKYNATQGKEEERVAAAAKAVRQEFDKLMDAQMSATEVQQSFNAAMRTEAAQTQILNNKLAEAAAQLATALTPAVMALTPIVVKAATKFAEVVGMLTGATEQQKSRDAVETNIEATNLLSSARAKTAQGGALSGREVTALEAEFKKLKALETQQVGDYGKVTTSQKIDAGIAGIEQLLLGSAETVDSSGNITKQNRAVALRQDIEQNQAGELKLTQDRLLALEKILIEIKMGKLRVHVENAADIGKNDGAGGPKVNQAARTQGGG